MQIACKARGISTDRNYIIQRKSSPPLDLNICTMSPCALQRYGISGLGIGRISPGWDRSVLHAWHQGSNGISLSPRGVHVFQGLLRWPRGAIDRISDPTGQEVRPTLGLNYCHQSELFGCCRSVVTAANNSLGDCLDAYQSRVLCMAAHGSMLHDQCECIYIYIKDPLGSVEISWGSPLTGAHQLPCLTATYRVFRELAF